MWIQSTKHTMAEVTAACRSPKQLDEPWPTSQGHLNDETFSQSIDDRHCAQNATLLRPCAELHRQRSRNLGKTLGDQDLSYFDFEPYYSGPLSRHSASTTEDTKQSSSFQDDRASGLISPPNSAIVTSSNPWRPESSVKHLTNILTHVDHAAVRLDHGQITPPDEKSQNLAEGEPNQFQTAASKKPKKLAARSRKKGTDTDDMESSAAADRDDQRYIKRSRFLERNRLAASKCRQKKKNWVENLEARARELLAFNNTLNLEVASLKHEVLQMKLEVARHRKCDSSEIQAILKQEPDFFAEIIQMVEQIGMENGLDIHDHQASNTDIDSSSRHSQEETEEPLTKESRSPSLPPPLDDIFDSMLCYE